MTFRGVVIAIVHQGGGHSPSDLIGAGKQVPDLGGIAENYGPEGNKEVFLRKLVLY